MGFEEFLPRQVVLRDLDVGGGLRRGHNPGSQPQMPLGLSSIASELGVSEQGIMGPVSCACIREFTSA